MPHKSIHKINPYKLASLFGILFALLGLLCGIIYALGGLLIDLFATLDWFAWAETSGLSYGTLLAFLALVGMPFIGAVIGGILGLVCAFLFNLSAHWLQWINLDVRKS